jgi:hypothetical protein
VATAFLRSVLQLLVTAKSFHSDDGGQSFVAIVQFGGIDFRSVNCDAYGNDVSANVNTVYLKLERVLAMVHDVQD